MQTAEFNYQDFSTGGMKEADKGLLVKFFVKAKQDMGASKTEGRPIYKDTEYVDIKICGNRGSGACRPATSADKQRFSEHYAAFKSRTEIEQDAGTPLVEWAVISRSQAEELAFFHIKTVEQLANMADTQISKFMGLMPVREKAQKWLKKASEEKPLWEMDQKIRGLSQENEKLRESLELLMVQLNTPAEEGEEKLKQRKDKAAKREAAKKIAELS